MMTTLECRFCGTPLQHSFVDLGVSPIANDLVRPEDLQKMEPFYPLNVLVCHSCFLVQLPEHESPERIFDDYTYFSSYSTSWLAHARDYVDMMVERFGYNSDSHIIEIASNDGYLLQYFKAKGIPVLGVEPAANVAKVAEDKGIPSLVKFFGVDTAQELVTKNLGGDLLIGNNVLAHVPNLNDFVGGIKIALKPGGIVTMEFPHLMRLMEENQYDTIYHEHYSYLSFTAVERVFAHHGLILFDVDELSTHGGSLRIFGRHAEDSSKAVTSRVTDLRGREAMAGFTDLHKYTDFQAQVDKSKRDLLRFLIAEKEQGRQIVGYGAPAKGNTLLNFCGIRSDFVDYTVDRSPHKQGRFLPGTRIPIFSPEKIRETQPDYLLILPWNLKEEIIAQMAEIREWGGKFVVPIPSVEVYS